MLDKEGKSRGFGYVQYVREEDAQAAIKQVNGATLKDKKIDVYIVQDRQKKNKGQKKPKEEDKKEEEKKLGPADNKGPREAESKNFAFVLPNIQKFPGSKQFWSQGIVNLFMKENWYQNDPNYNQNLQTAIKN